MSLYELGYDIHKEHGFTRSLCHSSKEQCVSVKNMILFPLDCVHAVFGKCLLRFRRLRTTSNVILLYKNINCKTLAFKNHFSPCFNNCLFLIFFHYLETNECPEKEFQRLINLQTTVIIFQATHLLTQCARRNLCFLSLVQYTASHLPSKRNSCKAFNYSD